MSLAAMLFMSGILGYPSAQAADMPPTSRVHIEVQRAPMIPKVVERKVPTAATSCSERCEVLHKAPGTGLKPAVVHEVCFRFTQASQDFVVFTLYDQFIDLRHNHILRQIKHRKKDGLRGEFCVGPQWVKQAVWADICNHVNHSDRDVSDLNEGLRTGVVSMCLLGEKCPRFVS